MFLRLAGRRAFRRERRRKAEKAMVSNAAIAQPRAALVGDLLCIYRVNMVSNSSMAWWRVDMLPFAVSPSRPLSARIRVQRKICTTVNKCVSSLCGLSLLQNLCENILTNACFCATRARARARPRYNKGAQVSNFDTFSRDRHI